MFRTLRLRRPLVPPICPPFRTRSVRGGREERFNDCGQASCVPRAPARSGVDRNEATSLWKVSIGKGKEKKRVASAARFGELCPALCGNGGESSASRSAWDCSSGGEERKQDSGGSFVPLRASSSSCCSCRETGCGSPHPPNQNLEVSGQRLPVSAERRCRASLGFRDRHISTTCPQCRVSPTRRVTVHRSRTMAREGVLTIAPEANWEDTFLSPDSKLAIRRVYGNYKSSSTSSLCGCETRTRRRTSEDSRGCRTESTP